MTKKEREQFQQRAETIARLERDDLRSREDYTRYDNALNGLMRDVLTFLADPIWVPTSRMSAQLIAAIEKASRAVHTRESR